MDLRLSLGALLATAVALAPGCGDKEKEPVATQGEPLSQLVAFDERAALNTCGTLSVRYEQFPPAHADFVDPAYDCFRRALSEDRPAEIRAISVNEEGRVPEYIRTLGSDGAEIYYDTRHGGNGEAGYYLLRCNSVDADLRPHDCGTSEFVGT